MDSFYTIPVGSIYSREKSETEGYIDAIQALPTAIKELISSVNTASYIVGSTRQYSLNEDAQAIVAFAILQIAIGKKTFAQFPAVLSSELQLPMDKAQKMAGEIEKDLFGPVRKELDAFLQSQKGGATSPKMPPTRPVATMRNVLDLKEIAAKPKQPQLPPKPATTSLPSIQKPSLQPKPPAPPKRPPSSPITPIHFS